VLVAATLILFFFVKARPRAGEVRRIWYWPEPRWDSHYLQLLTVFALLTVVSGAFVCLGRESIVIPALVITALTTLAAFHLRLRIRGRPKEHGHELEPSHWRSTYVAMMVMMAILVGVVPAVGAWRLAFNDVAITRLKLDQVAFGDAMSARRDARLNWYRNVSLSSLAFDSLARNIRPDTSGTPTLGFDADSAWTWRFVGREDKLTNHLGPLNAEWLVRQLAKHGLVVSGGATHGASYSTNVHWFRRNNGPLECSIAPTFIAGDVGRSSLAGRRLLNFLKLEVFSPVPRFEMPLYPWFWAAVGLALLGVVVVVELAVRFVFLEPFVFTEIDGPALLEPLEGATGKTSAERIRRALLLRFALDGDTRGRCFVINPNLIRRERRAGAIIRLFRASRRDAVLFAEFQDGLRDPATIRASLELIETLNAAGSKDIYIETSVEPLNFLHARFHDHYEHRVDLGIEIDRWAAALADYVRLRDGNAPPLVIAGERMPDEIRYDAVAKTAQTATAEMNQFDRVGTVLDLMKTRYRRIWTNCSSAEKLLLYRIAREGFVNRHARPVLGPLFRRGLVKMDPNCHLVSDSFRSFVLTAEAPSVFEKWQRRGGLSAWSRIRTPILLGIGVLGVFFFTTQREALNQSLGLLAAVTASVPGIINLLGSVARITSNTSKS